MSLPLDREAGAWNLRWLCLAAFCAVTLTAVDAFLIAQSTGLFVGGFFVERSLSGPAQVAGFLLCSLVFDGALVLGTWALVLPVVQKLARRERLLPWLAGTLALAGPLLFVYVRYQLHRHLGAMLDLDVLLAMAGDSPIEWIGQARAQLLPLALGVLLLGILMVALLILARRQQPERRAAGGSRLATGPLWGAFAASSVLALVLLPSLCLPGGAVCDAVRMKPAALVIEQLVRVATDFDRDGFGALALPADPALFDARIHPYALDTPGNGIDENGLAGDHPSDFSRPGATPSLPQTPWPERPNVLLIFLESFRADTLGLERDGRPVTPTLNRLARAGAATSDAYVATPFTIRSLEQLLTGRVAPRPGDDTLFDDFRAQGYEIAYFSSQDETFSRTAYTILGLDRVDHFFDARQAPDEIWSDVSAGARMVGWRSLHRRLLPYLAERRSDAPLLLYVNYSDSHYPYAHPGIEPLFQVETLRASQMGPEQRDAIRANYANAAANVDRAIGDLLEAWRAHSGPGPAPVLVTSDHGEALYEDGYLGHGLALDALQTRVPLIVQGLGGEWPVPISIADLRGQIVRQLAAGRVGNGGPRFVPDRERRILQFTARAARPRLLALRGLKHALYFDTERHELRVVDDHDRPLELADDVRDAEFRLMIRWWESLLLDIR